MRSFYDPSYPVPSAAVRALPAAHPQPARLLTPRELQLAPDVDLARGDPRRGELLSWAVHEVRDGLPA